MNQLLQAFAQLSRRQKLAVTVVFVLVLLTWMSVCLVLALPTT